MEYAFVFLKGVLLIHILKNDLLVNAGGCKASLATVSVVNRCPRTEEEWTTAAARKNCGNIKHNCVFIQYHCVMNTWRNKTIEVCAQSKNIIGNVCAEYNIGGARIQRNGNGVHCDSCPNSYNSTTSFKYQECYLKVRTTLSTKLQVTTNSLDIDFTTHKENLDTVNATSNIEHSSSNIEEGDVNTITIFAVCVAICLLLFILLSLKMRSTIWTTFSGIFRKALPASENDSLKQTLKTEV
uniref:Uncharacterized protein LOC111102257 isoform X1 n=1 Tax=Crassostrea virginica TaxID=6565 RepID=A0A8B8AJ94_CRAVI|nr:uncharacterized protein LOC111102257 isoform X1 [Crassostrea virginica]